MPSDRTPVEIEKHMTAVLSAMQFIAPGFPTDFWERPKDGQMRFLDPPYALTRPYPSAGEFDGPLNDTRVDIILRVQILSVGNTMLECMRVGDTMRTAMVASVLEPLLITHANRKVQDIRHMVTSGGVSRDDDLPTPFYYDTDLYELVTTPA